MKNFIYILVLLIPFMGHAGNNETLAEGLEAISIDLVAIPVKKGCSTGDEFSPAEKCAIELCGLSNEQPSIYMTSDNYQDYMSEKTKRTVKKMTPKIEEMIDDELEDIKNFTREFEKKFKLSKGKINFSSWTHYDFRQMAESLFVGNYSIEVDQSKPIAERLTIEPYYPEGRYCRKLWIET